MITPQQALARLIDGSELGAEEMQHLMRQLMAGEVSPVMTAAILAGLRVKKETIGEITAAARVMRELVTPVTTPHNPHFVDIVGTGGDGAHTFNISTAAMFVAAAAGATVAKHGNRSVSSKSGAADVLEALGANIALAPAAVATCIEQIGCGFMFAPNHHPAMKHVAAVRREMGVRTLFNILGPLTNPAGAPNTLLGVFHRDLVGLLVRVMQQLGARHVMVVWGGDGLDEISLGATTLVGELKDGEIREYEIHPADFGLAPATTETLRVRDAAESQATLLAVLENRAGPARDIVALNAGAALYTANLTDSIAAGLHLANEALASGAARRKLDEFLALTRSLA